MMGELMVDFVLFQNCCGKNFPETYDFPHKIRISSVMWCVKGKSEMMGYDMCINMGWGRGN